MSQALYRKYRSTSLADVVGQDHITDILHRSLKAGRIAHAYLFTGPRGVGKTSIARILAHEINRLPYTDESNHLDIIEIDAASNNGVEDVRDLREKVQIAPVSAEKKVYIIDEVHMLSKPAFNALLKTLEEPPAHVVFILATTDVEKLPATIVSRTQRYAFRAIAPADAVKHLRHIATEENISISDAALELIAARGDGSFRDSISLLDQLANLSSKDAEITKELIEQALGLAPAELINSLIEKVESHDIAGIAELLEKSQADGISPVVLSEQLTLDVQQKIISNPHLLSLLDQLLDVAKSSQPAMKLLTVLASSALDHKPKTAALIAPPLEISATIEELSEQAEKPKPSLNKKTPTDIVAQTIAPEPQAGEVKKPAKKQTGEAVPFNWSTFVEYTREHYVAVYSVLSKCDYQLEDDELTIFAVNAFYKKKLDDPKYHTHLFESLTAIGANTLTIHTVPTRAPFKDSHVAVIADIMGGGIEVTPEAA